MVEVEVRNVHGMATAVGSAGPFTVVIDRPADASGGGHGFNGAELLLLAVAGCVSNDLFREAEARGVVLTRVAVRANSDFLGDPAVSAGVSYGVDLAGSGSAEDLHDLVRHVDAIAEIPNSLRRGTHVALGAVAVHPDA